MIEKFFTRTQTFSRMRTGILGPHLPAIAKTLDQAHYSTASIRLHLRAADHFGSWLQEKKIALSDVSDIVVETYIQGLARQCSRSTPNGRLPHRALGLRRLIEILGQTEGFNPATAAHPARRQRRN